MEEKRWWELQKGFKFIGQECWLEFLKNEKLEYHKNQPFHDYRTYIISEDGIIYNFEDNILNDGTPYREWLSTFKDDIDRISKEPFTDVSEYILLKKNNYNK
jgi:hypothetical protein